MADEKRTTVHLMGRGPHDLPAITNPVVRLHSSGEYVGIEAEVLHPETGKPADIFVRITLSPKDAMPLLKNLQALALDQGYESQTTVGHVVQSPGDKRKH